MVDDMDMGMIYVLYLLWNASFVAFCRCYDPLSEVL